jgi:hypothetical protein
MSNPDIRTPSVNVLYIAFPISILFVLITITFYYLKHSIPSFGLVFKLFIPIAAAVITAIANIVIQYTTCNTTDIGKAILGSLPTIIATIVGLGISSISYCRIPIVSVFAPLIMGKTTDITTDKTNSRDTRNTRNIGNIRNSTTKECCTPKLSLRAIEDKYPVIEGISRGFYIMFSILFGMVIGTGVSRIC